MSSISASKNEQLILETLKIANSALKLKNLKLNSLLEITNAINSNFSSQQLLKIFEFVLRNQLNIGRLLFYAKEDGAWNVKIRHGLMRDVPVPDVQTDLHGLLKVQEQKDGEELIFGQFEVVIPVLHKSEALAYLLLGDVNEDLIENTKTKHVPFIQTLANVITVAVENKRLFRQNILQAGVKREMELASEVQSMLFPRRLPNNEYVEMAALHQPHQEVGGDYYDVFDLGGNEVAFCIADVSGKGVSAALLMSNFQANLRALFRHETSLTDLVQELNAKVLSSAMGEKFITMFIAKYNYVTRVMQYINAGQCPPLLLSGDTVSTLGTGCPGIGMLDELNNVREGIIIMGPDDLVFAYTDGVVELENAGNREYGQHRLELVLLENQGLSPREVNANVMTHLRKFKGDCPYVDDIALLSVAFK
ncbi:MAG: PP2C family protein-serine/threonine phosphatase [Flavobacteriales bacterium]|nr:PP2C family protein-serine/threonine phosphatase [Flavobacteriales bacterium]